MDLPRSSSEGCWGLPSPDPRVANTQECLGDVGTKGEVGTWGLPHLELRNRDGSAKVVGTQTLLACGSMGVLGVTTDPPALGSIGHQ